MLAFQLQPSESDPEIGQLSPSGGQPLVLHMICVSFYAWEPHKWKPSCQQHLVVELSDWIRVQRCNWLPHMCLKVRKPPISHPSPISHITSWELEMADAIGSGGRASLQTTGLGYYIGRIRPVVLLGPGVVYRKLTEQHIWTCLTKQSRKWLCYYPQMAPTGNPSSSRHVQRSLLTELPHCERDPLHCRAAGWDGFLV